MVFEVAHVDFVVVVVAAAGSVRTPWGAWGRLRGDRPWENLDRKKVPERRAGPQKADYLARRASQIPQPQAGWVGGALEYVLDSVVPCRAVRAEWGGSRAYAVSLAIVTGTVARPQLGEGSAVVWSYGVVIFGEFYGLGSLLVGHNYFLNLWFLGFTVYCPVVWIGLMFDCVGELLIE